MDKDRVKGVGKIVAGSLKEAIGKVTGDAALPAFGTAQRAAGVAKGIVRNGVKK